MEALEEVGSKQGDRLSWSTFREEGRGYQVWLHAHHQPHLSPFSWRLRDPCCSQAEASQSRRTRLDTRQKQLFCSWVQGIWPLGARQPSPPVLLL